MTGKHRHIIIGGGFSGLRAARMLANRDDIDVVVVNPQSSFEYHGSLYRSANGYSPLETVIPYREIFQDTNVEFCQDFMLDINPDYKRIKLLSGKDMSYDSATLALGYEPMYFDIPGMREFSSTLYSLADALELRKSLAVLAKKSITKLAPVKVIVVGGGPTGVEVAVSVPYFFELLSGDRRVEVVLIEAQDRILGRLDEQIARQVTNTLQSQIDIQCNVKVIRASKTMLHIANNPSRYFDLLIWTAGSNANGYFKQRSDVFDTDRAGRVTVNQNLLSRHDGLYVTGDSAAVEFSGTASAAIEMGSYVANHVIANLTNQEIEPFQSTAPEYAIPTGHDTAVAMQDGEILTGKEGWGIRRQQDLSALSKIAPEEVAHAHWAKGENLASMVQTQ